jgi:beta-N-acetylhexosaminidase
VDSNPKNPIIGDRSFSHDPDEVARHVVAFVRGHQDEGLIACAKHFPGHGDTELDSHLHLPTVDRDRDELERCELRPFLAAVAAGVGSVMTSHVMYPAWDEESPATLSPRIIRALLRDGMAYDGVVFSDDLDMRAVADRWTMDEIVRGATEATVDLLLACNVQSRQYEAFEALVRDQETDRAGHRAAEDAVGRLHALRERFFLGAPRVPDLDRVGCHDHMVLAARASDRGGVA